MRNVQSVSGQSAGLGLKGLPVLREVSSSLWVTAEEKEWKWTCLFKSRSAFILWASQDPLAPTITCCLQESQGLGELPITLPRLGQLTTNIFGLCQGFLIHLIYKSGYTLPSSAPSGPSHSCESTLPPNPIIKLCLSFSDCSPPGSSVHGISQARILGWVAIAFSRGSSQPRDQTQVSCTAGRFSTLWATWEVLSLGLGKEWVTGFKLCFGSSPPCCPWGKLGCKAVGGRRGDLGLNSPILVFQVPPTMQETQIQSLDQEDTPEKEMATHSGILARGSPMDRGTCRVIDRGVAKESDRT